MKQKDLFDEFSYRQEFENLSFGDMRLNSRFIQVVERFAQLPSASINKACENWAETKSAYRLLDNRNVTTEEIQRCHFEQTKKRCENLDRVIVIQDTIHLNFHNHPKTQGLGSIGKNPGSKKTVQGLNVHSALAITEGETPLGLVHQHIWSRAKTGGTLQGTEAKKWLNALEEMARFSADANVQTVTVCDREADITELLIKARQLGTDIVIRSKKNRSVQMAAATENLEYFMLRQPLQGDLKIEIIERQTLLGKVWRKKRTTGKTRKVHLQVRFERVVLKHSVNRLGIKARSDDDLTFYAIQLSEKNPPKKSNEISWLLLTTLPVTNLKEALEVIEIYKKRWGIENYHKVLKSGCKIEECRLGTADRLTRYIAVMGIIGWRLYRLARLNRESPDAPCTILLTDTEWKALYCRINRTNKIPKSPPTLKQATIWIAQLGGYLNRNNDPPPGEQTMSYGWERLTEIAEMYEVMICG